MCTASWYVCHAPEVSLSNDALVRTSPTSSGSAPDDSALGGVTGLEAVLEEFFDEFLEATAIQRYPTRGGGGRRAKACQSKQARCTGLGGKKGESLASSPGEASRTLDLLDM